MSLVIAIKDKDRFVFGADKQVSTGVNKDHTCTKIWKVQDLPGAIMGGVGSARASQIIQYSSIIDKNIMGDEPTTSFIITTLAPTLLAALKLNGITAVAPEDENCAVMPNAFLFAYKDKAWLIWNDLSVIEIDDYFAIGTGSDVARGVLFATPVDSPFERIVTSIDAAADSTLFVDDGIDLLVTKQHDNDVDDIAKALGVDLEDWQEQLSDDEEPIAAEDVKKQTTKKKQTKQKK